MAWKSIPAPMKAFIKGSVALSIICGFVLVALCSFAFAHTLNVFTGFAGLDHRGHRGAD